GSAEAPRRHRREARRAMSDRMFADVPTTSEVAFATARKLDALARRGFRSESNHPPIDVEVRQLRRLGAWLAEREFEAISAAHERKARACMAQAETALSEAW